MAARPERHQPHRFPDQSERTKIIFNFRANQNEKLSPYPPSRPWKSKPVRKPDPSHGPALSIAPRHATERETLLVATFTLRPLLDRARRPRLASPMSGSVFASTAATAPANSKVMISQTKTRSPLPASTVFDAGIHGTLSANVQWHLAVTNVFDRAYASVKYLGEWYPADGRSWRAGLRIPF